MNATIRLNTDDLDLAFLQRMKEMFAHQEIEIVVLEQNETQFLLSDPKTRERLLESIEDLKHGKNLVPFDSPASE